jgi:hypothetical protein
VEAAWRAGAVLTVQVPTRAPVKNRVRITRHCAGSGRSGHDRTCVGASFERLRARGLRPTGCGSAAGVGSMRYPLRICTPRP